MGEEGGGGAEGEGAVCKLTNAYPPDSLFTHVFAGGPELSPSEKREQIAEKERLVKLEERGKRVLFKV